MNDPTIKPRVRRSYKAVIIYDNGRTETALAYSLDGITSLAEMYSEKYQSEIQLVKITKICV